MRDTRIRTLLSDTLLFALGNLTVKLIQFVLLPIYTLNMTTAQFGIAELLNGGVELAYPLVCLGLYEATFRFALDKGADHRVLMTNALAVWALGSVLLIPAGVLIHHLSGSDYVWYILALLVLYSLRLLLAQYARGSQKVGVFVASGVLSACVLLLVTILCVAMWHMGVEGYLLAMICAHGISAAYLSVRIRIWELLRPSIDLPYLGDMVAYSLPLVPNSLAWWANNISSRYIVKIVWGAESAGLFVAAGKLPAIINLLIQVFQQAWQISAISSLSERDAVAYTSKVLRGYVCVVTAATSLAILLVDPIVTVLLAQDFQASRLYIPLLMCATLLNSLASFLGAFYSAAKKSGKLLGSTAVGALVCVGLSALLTPLWGIWGSAISMIVSNAVIAGWRLSEARAFVALQYSRLHLFLSLVLVLLQAILSSLDTSSALYASWGVALLIAILTARFVVASRPRSHSDRGGS